MKLEQVGRGEVEQSLSYPAKLVVNTDQQAHVSSTFSARVDSVNVALGQQVEKGQALATLFVPDLVDQQANLSMAQEALTLAQQDYQREKQLWEQGVSARQDYQRAYNAYRQAQIQVQAANSRLSALGANRSSKGRYVLTAPLSGVISNKDIVIGEQIGPENNYLLLIAWISYGSSLCYQVQIPIFSLIRKLNLNRCKRTIFLKRRCKA